jgi:polyhydroxyalkanoate synthesis regulator phasin
MVLYEKYVDDLVKKGLVTMADAKSFLGKDAA